MAAGLKRAARLLLLAALLELSAEQSHMNPEVRNTTRTRTRTRT